MGRQTRGGERAATKRLVGRCKRRERWKVRGLLFCEAVSRYLGGKEKIEKPGGEESPSWAKVEASQRRDKAVRRTEWAREQRRSVDGAEGEIERSQDSRREEERRKIRDKREARSKRQEEKREKREDNELQRKGEEQAEERDIVGEIISRTILARGRERLWG